MGAGAGKKIVADDEVVEEHTTVVTVLPRRQPTVEVAETEDTDPSTVLVESPNENEQKSLGPGDHGEHCNPLFQDDEISSKPKPGTSTRYIGKSSVASKGQFSVGQQVHVVGLEKASHLNGQEATTVQWEEESGRWIIRLKNGGERLIRSDNLQATRKGDAPNTADIPEAGKELEAYLLQSNWASIYQLFYTRFGIASLEKLERGFIVKSAVEMTLSIVSKCFALLRSDPNGRLHCTPLHIAALQSSTEAAEVIVRDLPQLVSQTHLSSPTTLCPLHIAILCGAHAVAELLLEGRANPNVRTLHDVSPLHIAATSSKEMCQILLAYHAEPQQRDVMGSGALHYAATFKQNATIEVLLTCARSQNHGTLLALARDVDQKRVTALHITCALYAGQEDMCSPMLLLAHGAKPSQVDCHGAPSRELVPWSRSCPLRDFFDQHGDKVQVAAQAWLDDQFLKSGKDPSCPSELEGVSDGTTPTPSPRTGPLSARSQSTIGQSTVSVEKGFSPVRRATVAEEASRQVLVLANEVEKLRGELVNSQEMCAKLEKERNEIEHLRAKVNMLEQSTANQQRVFDGLQELYENERHQHKEQVDTLQCRLAADMEALQKMHDETEGDLRKQVETQQNEFRLKVEQMQSRSKESQAGQAAAEAEQAALQTKLMEATLRSPTTAAGRAPKSGEMQRQLTVLETELVRMAQAEEQTRATCDAQRGQLQDVQSALQSACLKHALSTGDSSSPDNRKMVSLMGEEIARLQCLENGVDTNLKASQEQLQIQVEETNRYRKACADAEDGMRQVQRELQQMQNRNSASELKLETKLQELELQHSRVTSELRADAEVCKRRADAAEEQNRNSQSHTDGLWRQLCALEDAFREEQKVRKKFHNQIQDIKGAIRVFCRFRPMVSRETGEEMAVQQVDAFTVELKKNGEGGKTFGFDSVFNGDCTQEDIFADCGDLVQSAVDGYNVTIFAYGQTGAGKTHTMYGSNDNPGLAPRSIRLLFDVIRRESKSGAKSFKVRAYMIEVYKQDILDLLCDKPPPKDKKGGLEVKKDPTRGMMYVDGVTEKEISSAEQLLATLAEGEKKRHVTATKMNAASSRSHLLFSIIIEATEKETSQYMYGKITLCDLAGSERPKKSEVTGDALKEAIEINKSLSALGDVIEALTKGAKSIPYRNHKLTMLMQDSLGGSAKTLMFVNCSPAVSNHDETLMSLKWASRARQVTNSVKRNADSKEVARLKGVIKMMSQAQNAETILDDETAEPCPTGKMDLQMAMNATMRM